MKHHLGIMTLTISALLVMAGCVSFLAIRGVFRSPQAALAAFVAPRPRTAEDQLGDPLILTGRRAVPLVSAAIADRSFPNRRYAIGYLGGTGDPRAIPALERLVTDSLETDYIRADALESLACISSAKADSLAIPLLKASRTLSNAASQVFDGPFCSLSKRTFWDALLARHG